MVVAESKFHTPVADVTGLDVYLGIFTYCDIGVECLVVGVGLIPCGVECEVLEEAEVHTYFP